jgi:hypothetical protein
MNAKILEYLVADSNFVFTVDTSKNSVTVSGAPAYFANGGGQYVFQKGDSFLLLAYGIMLPENFTFYLSGAPIPILDLRGYAYETPAYTFTLPAFGSSLIQKVLEENRELTVEGFCNYNDFVNTPGVPVKGNFSVQVRLGKSAFDISMLNVPAAANSKQYYAVPFLKIAHNLPLQ